MPAWLQPTKQPPGAHAAGVIWCGMGALACFAWFPGTVWDTLLISMPSRWFLPVLSLAFAAGWAAGITGRLRRWEAQEGTIRARASLTGMATAVMVCATSCVAIWCAKSDSWIAGIIYTVLALLPAALFASIGAHWATASARWQWSAVFPALAALIWPVGYVTGRVLEKPPLPQAAPVANAKPAPPKPRYVKPEGFDAAHAWKRVVMHEDMIPNVIAQSPLVLSHDERRLAFLVRENGKHLLVLRHLYDSDADASFALDGAVAALAWSPDDSRIIYLSIKDSAFWVCEIAQGKTIPLPIPKLNANKQYRLVWWQDEAVLVYRQRGDLAVLSLDSLRMTAASDHAAWKAVPVEQQTDLGQQAFSPDMLRNGTAKFAFIGGVSDRTRTLVLNDDESLYSRFIANAEHRLDTAFPNRDGTMFFIAENEHLRILQLGLRESPPLRFIAESNVAFPSDERVKGLLTKRSVRAAIAAPIVNPLNGKTVAGDAARIKGYARFVSSSDRRSVVWIEQERERIQEGDVLIALSAIQGGDEFSVSRDWWAVFTKADDSQSIPRRSDVPILIPSETRELRPLPESAQKPTPATPERPSAVSPPQAAIAPPVESPMPQMAKAESPSNSPPPPAISPPAARKVAPSHASQVPALPANASPVERAKHLVAMHHANISDRNVDAIVADYASNLRRNDQDLTRDQMRQRETASASHVLGGVERVDGPISVEAQQNNRFHCEYSVNFEWEQKDGTIQNGSALVDLDVLLTGAGPKIVLKRTRIYKMNRPKRK